MIGIVDVGGGLRGIFGAGVLDYCMEEGIRFDYCIGVSAGSANVTSYAAHQPGRNYHYYIEYSFRKAYLFYIPAYYIMDLPICPARFMKDRC